MRYARWILLTVLIGGCSSGPSPQSRQQLQSGYHALQQQDYDTAMTAADQFLRDNPRGGPGTAEALYLQGRVYEQRALSEDQAGHAPAAHTALRYARSDYEQGLSLRPTAQLAALLRAGIANIDYFEEDYSGAVTNWRAAYPQLSDADSRAWVLYRIGVSQQRLGQFTEADKSFTDVRREYPGSVPAQRSAAHLGARAFYVRVGAFADARNAQRMMSTLRAQGFPVASGSEMGTQAVRVGPAATYAQAKSLQARLLATYAGAEIEP